MHTQGMIKRAGQLLAASILIFSTIHVTSVSAASQKMTIKWSGDCRDGEMIESLDDDNCKVTATVSPRTPARTIKLELMDDGGWVGLDTKKTRSGKATFEVSATDASDNWLDAIHLFRVSAAPIKGNASIRSKSFMIEFAPADEGSIAGPVKIPGTAPIATTTTIATSPASAAPTTSTVTPTTAAPTTTTIPIGSSRETPYPFGATVSLSDSWSLKILSITPDATQAVLDENMFNDPPATGKQFFIARVQATYNGSGSKRFDGDYRLRAVGQSAVTYTTFNNSCGVIPDDLPDPLTFTGGSIVGNLCWEITSSDAGSLIVYDSPFLGKTGNFMALR